jgi:PTH2 family peptidyl-tRNA hydrolase
VSIFKDACLTQLPKGTITCIGIGPDKEEKIDKITKKLKLIN